MSKKQYPSKRKSKKHKYRQKYSGQVCRKEKKNEDLEASIVDSAKDIGVQMADGSDISEAVENVVAGVQFADHSTDLADNLENEETSNNTKKPYYGKRKSCNYKYRQKRLGSRGAVTNCSSSCSNGPTVHLQKSEFNTSSSASSFQISEGANLNPESTSMNPIILEKVAETPVQILVDVPLERDRSAGAEKKEKRNLDDSGCSSDNCCDISDSSIEQVASTMAKDRADRFIVDAIHFSQAIAEAYEDHKEPLSTCTMRHWELQPKKQHYGLITKFTFKCSNCLKSATVFSESYEEHLMDLNTAVVAGTLASGIGHTQLEQILASMGIYCMTDKTYTQKQSKVCQNAFDEATTKSMEEAILEEIELAKKNGDVVKHGDKEIPFITVIIDGSWMKRTYGSHWNSASGTAAIIGARTGKVLFFGIRNKYCLYCARVKNQGGQPSDNHDCQKNWDSSRPSTAMEIDIILQGFRESIEKYNVIYKRVIMDNDSSLYKAIKDSNVYLKYNIVPERIICSVHLSKNMCKNLRKAADSNQTFQKGKRGIGAARELIKKNIETMRLTLKEAIKHRVKDKKMDLKSKITNLRFDILNIPSHVFGEHKMCRERGKKCVRTRKNNNVSLLKSFGLYDKVDKIFRDLSCHSESLIHQESTNVVELLNSLICRSLGGKRINWGLKSQYKTRVTSQVLQFNTGNAMSEFYKVQKKLVPNVLIKVERKRYAKMIEARNRRQRGAVKDNTNKHPCKSEAAGKFYGEAHQDVDMSDEDMKIGSELWINDLKEFQQNSPKIERETIDKNKNQLWISLQKKILHADNFQTACSWKSSQSCSSRVKKILYPSVHLKPEAETYVSDQEKKMKKIIAKKEKCDVVDCGVFIDEQCYYLGASPTALVGENGLMQLVCSFDTADLPVRTAIDKKLGFKKMFSKDLKKGSSMKVDDIDKNSEIYYNIQGALHITKRKYCLLVISTKVDYICIKVEIDKSFWTSNMEKQLSVFFHECLLPEMVNSRHNRRMPIREPPETCKLLDAKKKKKEAIESLSCQRGAKRKRQNLAEVRGVQGKEEKEEEDDCKYVKSYRIKHRSHESLEWFRQFANNRIISYHHVRQIILTPHKWIDDDVLDRLVYIFNTKEDCPFDIQSVLYVERPDAVFPATRSGVQIIGGNCVNHWRTAQFNYDKKKLIIYDSLQGGRLSTMEMKYLKARFGNQLKKSDITFKEMNVYQRDGSSCGLFAAAYAVSLYFGEDPSNIRYVTQGMVLRRHLMDIITSHIINRFPISE